LPRGSPLGSRPSRSVRRIAATTRQSVRRPPEEPPFVAVQRAIIALAHEIAQDTRGQPIWLFTYHPNLYQLLLKSASRPLLRYEQAITRALLDRTAGRGDTETETLAQLIAGVSIAILRTAAIRKRELEATGGTDAPPVDRMLAAACEVLARQMPVAEHVDLAEPKRTRTVDRGA
jgi:hypothetical protein